MWRAIRRAVSRWTDIWPNTDHGGEPQPRVGTEMDRIVMAARAFAQWWGAKDMADKVEGWVRCGRTVAGMQARLDAMRTTVRIVNERGPGMTVIRAAIVKLIEEP